MNQDSKGTGSMKNSRRGFTLIELMVAVAIMGLLAAIALPSYQSYIRKSRRSDAFIALSGVQLAQEKWRANHTGYGAASDMGLPKASEKGYYTINIPAGSNTSTGYQVTAAAGTSSQAADSGCATLTVTVSSALTPTYYGPVVSGQPGLYYGPNDTCWVK